MKANEGGLLMLRKDWDTLVAQEGNPVVIDISATPLAATLQPGRVVGSFVQRITQKKMRILIFREDHKDEPFHINLDRYRVFADFRSREDYPQVLTSSATSDDQAMQDFHKEYVIIVPESEKRGHHLRDVPGIYKAKLTTHQ